MTQMTHDSYGKSDVRIMKVIRGPERHDIVEYRVDIRLEGDLSEGYTEGDNTSVLPTDTMKNTVYAMARKHSFDSPEQFALILAEHFVGSQPAIELAEIAVASRPWQPMRVGTVTHPHAFTQSSGERRTAFVEHSDEATNVKAGIRDLIILKSADSGFSDFVRDEYTTLEETDDRVLASSLEATWSYTSRDVDFNLIHPGVRKALLKVFSNHDSLSVQHTLYAMGEKVLQDFGEVADIHIVMPNKHNLPVDLEPFDMDNPHQILMPIDEPSGHIEATLRRG